MAIFLLYNEIAAPLRAFAMTTIISGEFDSLLQSNYHFKERIDAERRGQRTPRGARERRGNCRFDTAFGLLNDQRPLSLSKPRISNPDTGGHTGPPYISNLLPSPMPVRRLFPPQRPTTMPTENCIRRAGR